MEEKIIRRIFEEKEVYTGKEVLQKLKENGLI